MDLVNLIWIILAAAAAVAVVFVLCGCKLAGEYDASCERDAAQVKDECYYCPFPCKNNK